MAAALRAHLDLQWLLRLDTVRCKHACLSSEQGCEGQHRSGCEWPSLVLQRLLLCELATHNCSVDVAREWGSLAYFVGACYQGC